MRKLYKNNYGIASPLEFSIASMALISTLVVVTASMAPPVEQGAAQFYADANVKATEIMSLLLTSDSQAGLVIDPETSVPTPPTGSISDITISNSPPYEPRNPSPDDGATGVDINADLSWTGGDPDLGDTVTYDVYFGTSSPPPIANAGQSGTSYDPGTMEVDTYYWKIVAKDDHDPIHSTPGSIWDFTTESLNDPPSVSITYPSDDETVSGTVVVSGSALDLDGSVVLVQVKIDSGSWQSAIGTNSWSFSWHTTTVVDGSHTVYARSRDDDGAYSTIDSVTVTVENDEPPNNPPNQPSKPNGPTDCNCGVTYQYTVSTTDPNGDSIFYQLGIGGIPGYITPYGTWHGPYSSGQTCTIPMEWFCLGRGFVDRLTTLYVHAKDIHGEESGWSDGLLIIIHDSGHIIRIKCFLAGTHIKMADGTQKNIEDIQVGDILKAYDQDTDTFQNDKVVEVYHDSPDQMISDYYLIVNNDLKVTPDHHLYINNEWIQAGYLKIGDQLFKGKITSLEKIYEKVPSYNFETEKYHTYLVVFGGNIVIVHNRNYILGGNEEEISISRQTSVTENDYTALLSMDKIFELAEIPYQELKEILGLPDEYYFYITIGNSESIFLNYMPNEQISLDSANAVVTCSENVIIVDSVGYAYATITVTVVR